MITIPNLRSFLVLLASFVCFSLTAASGRSIFEVKIYQLTGKQQEENVEAFLKGAYLPALHRAGVQRIGVFKPVETDTALYGKRIVVIVAFNDYVQYVSVAKKLRDDPRLQSDGAGYWDAAYDAPVYARIETILLAAFEGSPSLEVPALTGPLNKRIYELRSYESPSEKLHINKVKMFNQGDEIGLFKRLGFNAVFYGDVVAGSRMPNLMYMTSFSTMADRDEHWKTFAGDAQWKNLSSMSEYQHNVSKINIYLLHPTAYSDF